MRALCRAARLAAWVVLAAPVAAPVTAQGVRGWSQTRVRSVQTRPLERLRYARDEVDVLPDGRTVVDGVAVSCSGPTCVRYRPGAPEWAVHASEDVGLTAWGLGLAGLSATALVRARRHLGGGLTWPGSDDPVDVILAYGELERGRLRLRLGRQETLSGLGFSGFDGAAARWTPTRSLAVEAYGGRSLGRALHEPAHEALKGLVDFLPDRGVVLLGAVMEVRALPGTAATARYQREILTDRSGLVSERASVDVSSRALRPVRLEASLDWDVALDRPGKAHATVVWAARSLPLLLEGTARRYVPYFELSTIWGFFSPVPYHDVGVRASWAPAARWQVWGEGAWRRYGDAGAVTVLRPLEDSGYRLALGGGGALTRGLAADVRYHLDRGAAAFLSAGDARLTWTPRAGLAFTAGAQSFQQFEEFRLGEERAWGGLLEVVAGVGARTSLDGGVSVLRHRSRGLPGDEGWHQARAWAGLRVGFGSDPGLRARALR